MSNKITTATGVIILIIMLFYLIKKGFDLAYEVRPYNSDFVEGFSLGEKKLKRKGAKYKKNAILSQNEQFMYRKEEADNLADKLDDLYDELEENYKTMKLRTTKLSQVSSNIISLKKKIKKCKLKIKTIYPDYDFEDFNLREENIFKRHIHPYIDDGDNVICFNQDKNTCTNKKGCKWNSHYRECEKEDSDSDSDGFWD